MKTLLDFINESYSDNNKIIIESKNFTYTSSQDSIKMYITIVSAEWQPVIRGNFNLLSNSIDIDELFEEYTYGTLFIEGTVEINNNDSDFSIEIKFLDDDDEEINKYGTELYSQDISSKYYGQIIDALCSEDSFLHDKVKEMISSFKSDIVDSWKWHNE
jgi:hypothetical protein